MTMKITYFTSIFVFTLGLITLNITSRAQAAPDTDILPPSVIEIPPLEDSTASPEIDITKILGEEIEDNTVSFAEKPSSQFADDILMRLNPVVKNGNFVDQSTTAPSNVNEIRRTLKMTPLDSSNSAINSAIENKQGIPVKSIP